MNHWQKRFPEVTLLVLMTAILASVVACQSATKDPAQPIVGKWKSATGSNPVVHEIRREGRMMRWVGHRVTQPRPWRTEGDVLIIDEGATGEARWKYKVEGDRLTLIRDLEGETMPPEVFVRTR